MRWIFHLSNAVLNLEKKAATALAALLVLLILLNITTRAAGSAIFWVDELAVFTMIWMAFIGASTMTRTRYQVAVTLFTDLLPSVSRKAVARFVDGIIVVLAITLLVLCWQWYGPVALLESGFDLDLFARNTFKFIYNEPTSTVGIRKFWVWLAVPVMAFNMTLHAIANLLEDSTGKPASHGDERSTRQV